MKEILAFIDHKTQEFTKIDFFKFLQNKQIDPRQRLAFAPCIAPFAMSFGELNRDVFRAEPTTDPVQQLINTHTFEDENHWPWLLEDIEKLGLNRWTTFNDGLRFLWGQETAKARQAAYYLYHYTAQAPALQRLIVIDATEATGNVMLRMTAKVIRELQLTDPRDYPYFGNSHLVVDTGHTFCTSEGRQFIESIELDEANRQQGLGLVEKTFEVFTDLMQELMIFAQSHPVEPVQPTLVSTLSGNGSSNARSTVKNFRRLKPLGAYLLDAGLVTSEQIDAALDEQSRTSQQLGNVLSNRGWVNQQTIEFMMEKVILPERELAMRN
jgi:hypothetical protein